MVLAPLYEIDAEPSPEDAAIPQALMSPASPTAWSSWVMPQNYGYP